MVIVIGNVNELARLLDQGLGNRGMRVAESGDGDASAEIEKPLARHVIDVASRSVTEHEVEASVTRDHVLLEQGLDARHIVAHDGRR